ncbi:MAG: hypothetical protein Q9169_004669 [Polycauliona sp. 2 TL-2023]
MSYTYPSHVYQRQQDELPLQNPMYHSAPLIAILSLFITLDTAATAPPSRYFRDIRPECWTDPQRFVPIVFKDCIDVINKEITRSPFPPTAPLTFSKDPTLQPDIILPKYWTRGESKCGVGVDFAPRLRGYDRTTLDDIQKAARAVGIECIIGEPHLGGFLQMGWHDRLGVLVAGRSPRVGGGNGSVEES